MLSKYILSLLVLITFKCSFSQQLTGVWKGRINNSKVELKFIQNGDSITGTSYYHDLIKNYRRYSIKGYFDPYTNSVVWWDDLLIASKGINMPDKQWHNVADFDCPGGSRMYLDGKASNKETKQKPAGEVTLFKINKPSFHDEWDFILDTYLDGGRDPYLIDSISKIALSRKQSPPLHIIPKKKKPTPDLPVTVVPKTPAVLISPEAPVAVIKAPVKPLTIDEMFTTRKKVFFSEIPLTGDSIELKFYDNAEVDGDSISLFLNQKLMFTHVRLTGSAYVIKLPVKDMHDDNELVMVAENLGAIPPNTSLMVATVGDKRYEAHLESTETSNCLIKLKKK